ncbi:glycoside hydrolase family 93 protein [Parathielavia appendiculata]|uniref:Glycoside hydrolase family 93 protein n=1 Tax=Parathielavia appendiculata TaxID=2587402 RepID=A0AAN6TU34_9PEZI|nr:glycoside hydrolase family 93 protein [Parathielavia appendiculata]
MPLLPWPRIVFPRNPFPLLWFLLTTISLTIIFAHPRTNHRFTNQVNYTPNISSNLNSKPSMDTLTLTRGLHVAQQEHFVHDVPGTYPRLCRLVDGSILAGFTTFAPDGQTRVLAVARSVDDARTFEPHGEVARSPGDCDNLFLLQLPPPPPPSFLENGEIAETETDPPVPVVLAAFRNHDLDDQGNPTWFRITVCQSRDGGRSWSFLSQAFEKPAPFGLWEPFLRLGRRGGVEEVQLYFSQEMDTDDQDTMVVRSTDGGRTWSSPSCVTGRGERLRDGMVGVAETEIAVRARTLVMVLETTRRGPGTYSIEAILSFDGGENFVQRQVVYEPATGRNAGAPQIAALNDGLTVAIVFMTDEDMEEGEATAWPQGAKIKAMYGSLRKDGLLVLGAPVVVGESASSWPGIMALSGNSALAVFESSRSIRGRLLMSPGNHAN